MKSRAFPSSRPWFSEVVTLFRRLVHDDKVRALKMMLGEARVCPRCLRDFRFQEEVEAKLCKNCVLDFVERVT